MTRLSATLGACVLACAALGCTQYYAVTDPVSQKTYYTHKVKHSKGAVRFKDATTGREVSLASAEVDNVDKGTFKAGTSTGD